MRTAAIGMSTASTTASRVATAAPMATKPPGTPRLSGITPRAAIAPLAGDHGPPVPGGDQDGVDDLLLPLADLGQRAGGLIGLQASAHDRSPHPCGKYFPTWKVSDGFQSGKYFPPSTDGWCRP